MADHARGERVHVQPRNLPAARDQSLPDADPSRRGAVLGRVFRVQCGDARVLPRQSVGSRAATGRDAPVRHSPRRVSGLRDRARAHRVGPHRFRVRGGVVAPKRLVSRPINTAGARTRDP